MNSLHRFYSMKYMHISFLVKYSDEILGYKINSFFPMRGSSSRGRWQAADLAPHKFLTNLQERKIQENLSKQSRI